MALVLHPRTASCVRPTPALLYSWLLPSTKEASPLPDCDPLDSGSVQVSSLLCVHRPLVSSEGWPVKRAMFGPKVVGSKQCQVLSIFPIRRPRFPLCRCLQVKKAVGIFHCWLGWDPMSVGEKGRQTRCSLGTGGSFRIGLKWMPSGYVLLVSKVMLYSIAARYLCQYSCRHLYSCSHTGVSIIELNRVLPSQSRGRKTYMVPGITWEPPRRQQQPCGLSDDETGPFMQIAWGKADCLQATSLCHLFISKIQPKISSVSII